MRVDCVGAILYNRASVGSSGQGDQPSVMYMPGGKPVMTPLLSKRHG